MRNHQEALAELLLVHSTCINLACLGNSTPLTFIIVKYHRFFLEKISGKLGLTKIGGRSGRAKPFLGGFPLSHTVICGVGTYIGMCYSPPA